MKRSLLFIISLFIFSFNCRASTDINVLGIKLGGNLSEEFGLKKEYAVSILREDNQHGRRCFEDPPYPHEITRKFRGLVLERSWKALGAKYLGKKHDKEYYVTSKAISETKSAYEETTKAFWSVNKLNDKLKKIGVIRCIFEPSKIKGIDKFTPLHIAALAKFASDNVGFLEIKFTKNSKKILYIRAHQLFSFTGNDSAIKKIIKGYENKWGLKREHSKNFRHSRFIVDKQQLCYVDVSEGDSRAENAITTKCEAYVDAESILLEDIEISTLLDERVKGLTKLRIKAFERTAKAASAKVDSFTY